MSSGAWASFVRVGLCDGQTSKTDAAVSKTGRGTISAALVLPKERLAPYAGMNITGIRMALAKTDGLSQLQGWVATDFTADALATASVSTPETGWNEVSFASPVTISATDDLVVGYSFYQEKSCKTILLGGLDEDNDFPAALNGCWIGKDGEWENRSQKSGYDGSVCCELIVSDESLPEQNPSFYSISLNDNAFRPSDTLKATVVLTNLGPTAVQASRGFRIDDNETTWADGLSNVMGQQQRDTLAIEIDLSKCEVNASHTLTLVARYGNGTEEKTTSLPFVIYDDEETYAHHLLIEEFSTETCPNCERAIKTLEQMEREGLTATCSQITHHVGYTHDFLSVPEDKAYEWLYGNNGTWAPAIMFSRTYDKTLANKDTGVPAPMMSVGYADAFRPYLQHFLDCDALVSVTPMLTWNAADRTLSVDVTMEKSALFDTQCPSPRISVILTEDSVRHHEQAGYSSETDFRHRHVYRETLSSTWGDEISWNGNTATAHYQTVVPTEWTNHDVKDRDADGNIRPDTCQVGQLAVVAFVNAYDADYRTRCRVYNSGTASLHPSAAETGIGELTSASPVVRTEYYDATGRRLATLGSGLNVVVVKRKDGTTTVRKLIGQ